jgi:hypothetical protein
VNNKGENSERETEGQLEKVTFLIHGRATFQDPAKSQNVTEPPMESVTVLLSPLNARRLRNNPLQETFYGYWHHTAEKERSFDAWLSELWDETNQQYRLPNSKRPTTR